LAKVTKRAGRKQDVIARRATQHHDFIGDAEAERKKSREAVKARVQHDHELLEKEAVREMAHEVEEAAGLREPSGASEPKPHSLFDFERPKSLREALELFRKRGPEALELLRKKAEERLARFPKPVVDFTGRAAGLLLWPLRLGTELFRTALRTPAALWRVLGREKREV